MKPLFLAIALILVHPGTSEARLLRPFQPPWPIARVMARGALFAVRVAMVPLRVAARATVRIVRFEVRIVIFLFRLPEQRILILPERSGN